MKSIGLSIIILGGILIVIGVCFLLSDKCFLGKLPGDIRIKGDNSSFYFPVTTCIIISVILSIILSVFAKYFHK